ncbi:hypothetical protein HK096_009979 [Nowakowskiella sp. JEL0078]|nr:hypothetical protein HK096_009979 [Nowakowskiella sp. JEL0078]
MISGRKFGIHYLTFFSPTNGKRGESLMIALSKSFECKILACQCVSDHLRNQVLI